MNSLQCLDGPNRQSQKTREGCGCFRGLLGASQGKLQESPGKIAGKIFSNREMLQILGFRALGKANLRGTLGRHCRDLVPTFSEGPSVRGVFWNRQFQPSRVFWQSPIASVQRTWPTLAGHSAVPLGTSTTPMNANRAIRIAARDMSSNER